jgi:hypothetical protein
VRVERLPTLTPLAHKALLEVGFVEKRGNAGHGPYFAAPALRSSRRPVGRQGRKVLGSGQESRKVGVDGPD